jgi:hypothetical protein
MPFCNGVDIGCVGTTNNIIERESVLTSLGCFTRENLTNRFMRQGRLRPEKLLEGLSGKEEPDQTVRPIARSLQGWGGAITIRPKPFDNVPTLVKSGTANREEAVYLRA